MNSVESDVLTESVTEDSADDQQITRKLPVRRAKKGLKRLKGKTGSQHSGGLLGRSGSLRQKWARRWCDAGRGRKGEPDTPYAIGRFDHNSHETEEKCGDSGGY